MKNIRKIFAIVCSICLLLAGVPVSAAARAFTVTKITVGNSGAVLIRRSLAGGWDVTSTHPLPTLTATVQ